MSESLHMLELKRAEVLGKMAALGDLRPGSLTTTQGKCGKAQCCCKEPDHPGRFAPDFENPTHCSLEVRPDAHRDARLEPRPAQPSIRDR